MERKVTNYNVVQFGWLGLKVASTQGRAMHFGARSLKLAVYW